MRADGYKLRAVRAGRPRPEVRRVEPPNGREAEAAGALRPESAGSGGDLPGGGEPDADPV